MDGYFQALKNNLAEGMCSPYVTEMMASAARAYKTIISIPPTGPLLFGRLLLICGKSMFSATALIAERQPEDSVAVTRRALEVAKVALAVKLKDTNAAQWTSHQERHDRWLKRLQREKPKPFRVEFTEIRGEPLMDEIDRWLGILSDAYVHFTPEFYDSLDWQEQVEEDGNGKIFLHYFHRNNQRN